MEPQKYDVYSAGIGYNHALDDFVHEAKRIIKEKQGKGEQLTTRDIDKIRKILKFQ